MKVLVIGSGGREHAICLKLSQSTQVSKVYCAPGNAGIEDVAQCVPISATDIEKLVSFAKEESIDFVCVTPDDPLALGAVDAFENEGIPAFGPTAAAARIESSKVFCKDLLFKYNIPTALSKTFTETEEAKKYVASKDLPIVIKADGLAKGKGVIIAETLAQAEEAIDDILDKGVFGDAGASLLVEDFLTGPEVSLLCFADGKNIVCMPEAQDHKRIFDNDQGPNTGGMGAFSPSKNYTPELHKIVMETILLPTMEAMEKEGCAFKGVLYCGLMLTPKGPMVLEYNARFGDPETQVIIPLLKSDLLDVMKACRDGILNKTTVNFSNDASAIVVMSSFGYPGKNRTGDLITGLDTVTDATVYHAGTKRKSEAFVTDGGRVLGVSATGSNLEDALKKAYNGIKNIQFDGAHYRTDIGKK